MESSEHRAAGSSYKGHLTSGMDCIHFKVLNLNEKTRGGSPQASRQNLTCCRPLTLYGPHKCIAFTDT